MFKPKGFYRHKNFKDVDFYCIESEERKEGVWVTGYWTLQRDHGMILATRGPDDFVIKSKDFKGWKEVR